MDPREDNPRHRARPPNRRRGAAHRETRARHGRSRREGRTARRPACSRPRETAHRRTQRRRRAGHAARASPVPLAHEDPHGPTGGACELDPQRANLASAIESIDDKQSPARRLVPAPPRASCIGGCFSRPGDPKEPSRLVARQRRSRDGDGWVEMAALRLALAAQRVAASNLGCPGFRATQVRGSEGRHYRGRTKRGLWRSQLPHRPEAAEADLRGHRALASRPKRNGMVALSLSPDGARVLRDFCLACTSDYVVYANGEIAGSAQSEQRRNEAGELLLCGNGAATRDRRSAGRALADFDRDDGVHCRALGAGAGRRSVGATVRGRLDNSILAVVEYHRYESSSYAN